MTNLTAQARAAFVATLRQASYLTSQEKHRVLRRLVDKSRENIREAHELLGYPCEVVIEVKYGKNPHC